MGGVTAIVHEFLAIYSKKYRFKIKINISNLKSYIDIPFKYVIGNMSLYLLERKMVDL